MPNLSVDFKRFEHLPSDAFFTRREVGEFFVAHGYLPASGLPTFLSRLKIRIVRHKVPTAGIKKGADGIPRNAYLGAALKLTFKGWSEGEQAALKTLADPSATTLPAEAMLFTSPPTAVNGSAWRGTLPWLAGLAVAALIALAAVILIDNEPEPGRQELLRRWRETRDPDIVAQLADHPVQPATDLSLSPPLQALFLCEPYPAVLCGDALLMIGDWVSRDEWTGYITEVTVDGIDNPFLSLKVRNEGTTEVIRWPLSGFKGPDHIYIYSSGNNLASILSGLQRLADLTIAGRLDGGLVHGTYAVDSYETFIDTIAGACYLTFDGAQLFVNPTAGVRCHIRENRFLRNMTRQEILNRYRDLLGMQFGLDHEINGGVVTISRSLPR